MMRWYLLGFCFVFMCSACRHGQEDVVADGLSQTSPARPLSAGISENSKRLPDCSHIKEKQGVEPREGVNCSRWDLAANASGRTIAARSVVIGDVLPGIRDFQTGISTASKGVCVVDTVDGPQERPKTFTPVDFQATAWLKGKPDSPSTMVISGQCKGDGGFACVFASGGGVWNIGPGRALVFLNEDCCYGQVSKGGLLVRAIYPIENGMVYDYDGASFAIEEITNLIAAASADANSGEVAVGDNPCLPVINPPVGADTPDAKVGDVGQEQ